MLYVGARHVGDATRADGREDVAAGLVAIRLRRDRLHAPAGDPGRHFDGKELLDELGHRRRLACIASPLQRIGFTGADADKLRAGSLASIL